MSEKNIAIVTEINDAFTQNDLEGFLTHCSDDLYWKMEGDTEKRGKVAIREWMKQMEGAEPPKFTVDGLFGAGERVVCYGNMTMKGEDGKPGKYSYCDVYTFVKGKVTELRSFVVAQKPADKNVTATA